MVLFYAALEQRLQFACSSGAACSYRTKMAEGTGIEMAEVIPAFVAKYDIAHLVKCIAPRRLLVVSASEDPYSRDAGRIVAEAREAYTRCDAEDRLDHKTYDGGHALTEERFAYIVQWLVAQRAAA